MILLLITVICTVLIIMAIESENGWTALISLLFSGFIAIFCGSFTSVWDWIVLNRQYILISAAIYVVAGGIWSLFRWFIYVKEHFKLYPNTRPVASDRKALILMWIGWWPFSLVNTVVGKGIRRIFTHAYNICHKWYDKIVDSVYGVPKANVED